MEHIDSGASKLIVVAVICILHGCSVPVVLRPFTNSTGSKYYQFIGDCYLHTMMDGRAIDVQESEELETVNFELR